MTDHATIVPVILSGGSGTRLWPMSRPERPKQMLALTGTQTMLQLTAARAMIGAHFAAPIVVANAAHADAVEDQLAAVGATPQALILEPMGRNTAPAIALAAIAAGAGDAPLLVMPSDHVIADVAAFHAAIAAALPMVRGRLARHLRHRARCAGDGLWLDQGGPAWPDGIPHLVDRFVEKPPLEAAQAMLASGDHAWNGGIFLFRADRYLEVLEREAPAMVAATQAAMDGGARRVGIRVWPDAEAFAASPSDLIDYGDGKGAPGRRRACLHGLERSRQLGRASCDQRHRCRRQRA